MVSQHRRSQDFVWGAIFLSKKVDDLFLVVALKERLNTPPNLTCPTKTVLKIDSCSGWGCTSCPAGVHLHIFPVNYAWKKFFHRPGGGAGAPTAPLATPMAYRDSLYIYTAKVAFYDVRTINKYYKYFTFSNVCDLIMQLCKESVFADTCHPLSACLQ